MHNRTFMVVCLFAALAACERPQEPLKTGAAVEAVSVPVADGKAAAALPEHFDRVRAEQFEKEEDRLRKHRR
jgi:hypothetical protein